MMDPIWAGLIGGIFGLPLAIFISRFNLAVVFIVFSLLLPSLIFIKRLIEAGFDAAVDQLLWVFEEPVVVLLFLMFGIIAVFVALLVRNKNMKSK